MWFFAGDTKAVWPLQLGGGYCFWSRQGVSIHLELVGFRGGYYFALCRWLLREFVRVVMRPIIAYLLHVRASRHIARDFNSVRFLDPVFYRLMKQVCIIYVRNFLRIVVIKGRCLDKTCWAWVLSLRKLWKPWNLSRSRAIFHHFWATYCEVLSCASWNILRDWHQVPVKSWIDTCFYPLRNVPLPRLHSLPWLRNWAPVVLQSEVFAGLTFFPDPSRGWTWLMAFKPRALCGFSE